MSLGVNSFKIYKVHGYVLGGGLIGFAGLGASSVEVRDSCFRLVQGPCVFP